jgi:peptidoglycan/xylan/chitin deacetylase (PgdA/CDA1 family)
MGRFEVLRPRRTRPQLIFTLLVVVNSCLPVLLTSSNQAITTGHNFVQPARHAISSVEAIEPETYAYALAAEIIKQNQVVEWPSVDCQQVSCVALTFDDGPNATTTPRILDDLERAKVPATFFVLGIQIAGHEAVLQRMHRSGHQIGNHSWGHPNLTKLTPEQLHHEVHDTQAAIVAAGLPAPTTFRPPYGAINPVVEQAVGMSIMLWNEDPKDWAAEKPEQVVQAVVSAARPGGIIDMHDIYETTAQALPQIIAELKARGYHFVTVSELHDLTPESRGLYAGYHQP